MAKINIPFNGTDYHIDESALTSATTELQSHVQTSMAGSGAVIKLGGNTYNVDATKLTNERNAFVSHLGTIAGSGSKVTVNGVEYGVDSSKTSAAVAELGTVLGNLSGGAEPIMRAAGLYQTGTDTMTASWDELVTDGVIVVNDGAVSIGTKPSELPELPEKNEYGFYYGVTYSMPIDDIIASLLFNEDGSMQLYTNGILEDELPAGSAIYSDHSIDLNVMGWGICPISDDGTAITVDVMGSEFVIGSPEMPYQVEGDLVLPDDNSITMISDNAFATQSSLTGITIPNTVTSIGNYAFGNCYNLVKLNYMGTADQWAETEFIGYDSNPLMNGAQFYIDNNLVTTVNLTKASKISDNAFNSCNSLTEVIIGDSVTSIGYAAFSGCSSLESIELSSGITSIGGYAFSGCSLLTTIIIPDSVTSIGNSAFYNCNLTSIAIPDSVTSINSSIFSGCKGITSLTIGKGITSLDYNIFGQLDNLTEITLPFVGAAKGGTDKTHFGYIFGASDWGFNGSSVPTSLKKVTITGGDTIGGAAFKNCKNLTSIVIPDSVTSIGRNAFGNCISLEEITLPFVGETKDGTSNTYFGYIFGNDTPYPDDDNNSTVPASLKKVTITSANVINNSTFKDCSNLTSVVVLDGVTSIGYDAFYMCSSLTSVVIPDSVISIGNTAFFNCSSLTDVYYTGTEAQWQAISIGSYNEPLTNATIHYNYQG